MSGRRRPPAFMFYATDWNGSKAIQLMTARQCGYYINLMARAWDDRPVGSLPNDPDLLWRLAKADSRAQFEQEGALVLAQFKVRKDRTRIFHPRLASEFRKLLAHARQKSAAGEKGAKSKWDKEKGGNSQGSTGDGSAIVSPMAENGFSSSISYSKRRHKSSSDDDPLTLLPELQAKYPSYELTAEDLKWACGIIVARSKAPPGSLAFWRTALVKFMENADGEIAAHRKQQAGSVEAHAGHNPYGRAN